MSKIHLDKVGYAEVSKLGYTDNSITVTFFGESTKGTQRQIAVKLGPHMIGWFLEQFAGLPAEFEKIANEIRNALKVSA